MSVDLESSPALDSSPGMSPTLTDDTSDAHASPDAANPRLYHITEPWGDSDVNASSQPDTPRSPPTVDDTSETSASPPLSLSPPRHAWMAPGADRSSESPVSAVEQREGSPGATSTDTVENLVHQAQLLIGEANENEKGSIEQVASSKETSQNTTYRDLPRPPDARLADREVELLSKDDTGLYAPPPPRSRDDMEIDIANKVKNLMSDAGWRDRRLKSFDYDALKQDLADIERRLQSARTQPGRALWPPERSSTPQRKSHSLHDIQAPGAVGSGLPPAPDRTQSPDTLTSSGKASSLAELDRSRRLKWDYAADIASSGHEGAPGEVADELALSGEQQQQRMRMSMSQASFVSSPDPDDSALEAAMKSRDIAALQDPEPGPGSAPAESITARMEEILGRQDPQSHVAAILKQADEAERRLRARLRKTSDGGDGQQSESYLDALRSAHRESRTPLQDEGSWKRLNLTTGSSSFERPSGGNGLPGAMDSARSDLTNSGGDPTNSARQGNLTSARSTTTAESTHPGSDDAMGPSFPPSAYGSRMEPSNPTQRGIYFKAKGSAPQATKSPGFPQRSRVGQVAAMDETQRSRPPASPSAGCSDLRKSLETISSHDTGASNTAPTPEDPRSLEEYASKLRTKWERYQRLLSQHDRSSTPGELRDLLENPLRQASARTPGRDRTADSPASTRPSTVSKEAKGSRGGRSSDRAHNGRDEFAQASSQPRPRTATGRQRGAGGGEQRGSGGGGGGGGGERGGGSRGDRGTQQAGPQSGSRGRGVQTNQNGGGGDDSDPEEWRRRDVGRRYLDSTSGDDETLPTDTQDTLQLMTRMAGLLRDENTNALPCASPLRPPPEELLSSTDGTPSDLDPQLLRLKHLFLKQKEKWLYERSREAARRRKIRKLQRLIAERQQRQHPVAISESLDTDTIASSILSDLEEAADGRLLRSESDYSSAGTLTANSPPPPPPPPPLEPRQQQQQAHPHRATALRSVTRPEEERRMEAARGPREARDRRIQVYPPAQSWEIPPPRGAREAGARTTPREWTRPRPQPDSRFMDNLTDMARREDKGLQASGGGLSWYHPVPSRHVGVQGEPLGCGFDDVDPQVRLAQPLLTEAFEEHMGGFISRSRQRQKRIRLAAEERRFVNHMEAERVKLFTGDEAGGGVRRRPRTQPDPLSDNLYKPQRRAFSRREMREQNRRMRRALPEVQQRLMVEKKDAQVKSNILRKQLYSEKVLRAVLRKRGPWVLTF